MQATWGSGASPSASARLPPKRWGSHRESAVFVRYTPQECFYAVLPSMRRSRDMYRSLYLLCTLALPVLSLAYAARADEASDAAVYTVSYIEVMPASQGEAIALLRQYRE